MSSAGAGSEFSMRDAYETLKRRKYYILVPTVALALGAAAIAYQMPNRYRSRVLIAAQPAVAQSHVRDRRGDLPQIQEQLRAVRESLISRPVLEQVVREFDLYPLVGGAVPDPVIEDVRSRIQVQVEGEYHFYIGFEGESKEQSTEVANRLGDLFIERASAVRARRAREETRFLEEELSRVREDLVAQDQRIREYRREHAGELPERVESSLKRVETHQEQLTGVAGRIAEEEGRRASLMAEIASLEEQGVLSLREPSELIEKRQALEALRSRYKKGHPEMVRLEKEVEALEAQQASGKRGPITSRSPLYERYAQLKAELEGTELRLRSYRQERNQVASNLRSFEERLANVPEHERVLAKLEHDYMLQQTHYQTLLDRQQEAKLAGRLEDLYKGLVFTIVEPARPPSTPSSPHRSRLALMGLASGLGLGLLLAFGTEHMDTSFYEQEEVQAVTGLPVLASIPNMGSTPVGMGALSKDGKPRGPNGAHSLAAEQYRFLAVRLRERMGPGRQVLGVTSAVGGEGKSTTSINLATELASVLEGRVLIVDGDLRKPKLMEALGLSERAGLGELLTRQDEDLSRYIVKVEGEKLRRPAPGQARHPSPIYVLPAGKQRTDSVRLLGSRWAKSVFAQLRKEFDFIVVDLPPMIPIADSRVVAGLTSGLILVVRSRHTRRELLPRALDGFDKGKIHGVVLNDVDFRLSRCAYAYRYYEKHYQAAS